MAQDQIAKLMAMASKDIEANAVVSGGDASSGVVNMTPPPLKPSTSSASTSSTSKSEPANDQPARRVARRRPAGPVRGKIAANDDVPSIGGLIYALEQKPSTKVFRFAAVASLVWALIGIGFGAYTLAPQWTGDTKPLDVLLHPVAYLTVAAVVVPIAIFWLLAVLNWHIASLALKSSTMTEVAIRLAEPDRAAEQSIASLGQAVRRQVSFMNDAVSRALGRAGELEALVHNQVADLERSYEQNERRIRGLIQELTGERHALLNTSESVTDTLKTLGSEIPTLIEKLSTQQITLANIIRGAGDNLAALEGSLATSTGRFEDVIGTRTSQLQGVLEDYTTAFSTALGARTEQMRLAFDGYMQTLDTSLGNRTENLQTVFEEYARALDTTLANRAAALDVQLVERTQSLDDAFQKRLEMFDAQIVNSTTAIDSAVSEKAHLLTSALDLHARTFRETISKQAVDLDDSVLNGINAVRRVSENITRQTMKAIDGLAHQTGMLQNVSDNLFQQIHGVTNRFESQGNDFLRAVNVLDDANSRMETRHADFNRTLEALSGKADEFGRSMAGYQSTFEGSLTGIESRARAIADELRVSTEDRSRMLLADLERVKTMTETESERTLGELRHRFSSVSSELTKEFESLSSRLASASDETRMRAAQAAETLAREQARIRDEAARLPNSARDTAEAMRRALHDQLRALDQLSAIKQRAVLGRDVVMPEAPRQAPSLAATTTSAMLQPHDQTTRFAPPATQDRWKLGDLLARASTGDDAIEAARQEPFKLDVAMLARALDPATASAIWNRLRAGQRNVMVRSIYGNDARAVFDEIGPRVKTDPELAQSISRYLADFERIIKEADGRDPSGRLSHTHLVSDTGRVYLFLAHAVGRLG